MPEAGTQSIGIGSTYYAQGMGLALGIEVVARDLTRSIAHPELGIVVHDNFNMDVSGGYSYKTGRYTVTYSENSNTATVEEETKSGGGYNWLWNLIVLLYHSSMVMFFGILIAFYDNEKNKLKSANINKTQGALKIVKICVIYYFRFCIWCSGVGLTMYCLDFSFFGIIVIASIVLWRVIERVCKNV